VKERGVSEDLMASEVAVLRTSDVFWSSDDPRKSSAPCWTPAWRSHVLQLWAEGDGDEEEEGDL
jgi:hypothetical protein